MKNKKDILNYLRKHRAIVGFPIVVKFRVFNNTKLRSFKAKRGYYAVRWDYILKAFR